MFAVFVSFACIVVSSLPTILLPSSNTPLMRHSVRVILACGLTCQTQIRTGSHWPWETQLAVGVCDFTAAHLPLWWGRAEIKYEADKWHSEQTRSDGDIHMKWIHMVNPLSSSLFYKSHPTNDLFSHCIAMCSTSVIVFQSHDFL